MLGSLMYSTCLNVNFPRLRLKTILPSVALCTLKIERLLRATHSHSLLLWYNGIQDQRQCSSNHEGNHGKSKRLKPIVRHSGVSN
jgi:hypothetical protein